MFCKQREKHVLGRLKSFFLLFFLHILAPLCFNGKILILCIYDKKYIIQHQQQTQQTIAEARVANNNKNNNNNNGST